MDRIKQVNKYKVRDDGKDILNNMFQQKVEREVIQFDGWNDLMKLYAKPIVAIMNKGKNKRKRHGFQTNKYVQFIDEDDDLNTKHLREKHR